MNNYEQFIALARARRSIRQFSHRRVEQDDIQRIFEAARWAPSNHNRQPWKFIVLQDRSRIARLAEAVKAKLLERLKSLPELACAYTREFVQHATFFSDAPVLLAVLHKKPVRFSAALLEGMDDSNLISGEPLSVAMAVQNLLLAAHTLGLGTCMMTAPLIAKELIRAELKVPAGSDLTCLVALGYPSEGAHPPRRKSIDQISEFRENTERSKHDERK